MKAIKFIVIMVVGISVTFDCFAQPKMFVRARCRVGHIVNNYSADRVFFAAYLTALTGVTGWAARKILKEAEEKRICPCVNRVIKPSKKSDCF